jgi:BirA family biotin operon repressor/biotin-[acetyl-CoA-carboxylase] ligase
MIAVGKISQKWAEQSQIPVWYQETTTSTNLIAKDQVISESPVTLYLADHQTQGRGRGSNTWLGADAGSGTLLSSWVFQMRNAPQPVLAPAIGLAVWTALKSSFPWMNFSLKAPNDIYLDEKKIAGILLESAQHSAKGNPVHRLIVGLGINVWKSPSQIETAGSLIDSLSTELTEQNWIHVLDRLLLEISLGISQTAQALNENQRQSLKHALNLYPGLEMPYEKIDPDGSLWTFSQKINWSEL